MILSPLPFAGEGQGEGNPPFPPMWYHPPHADDPTQTRYPHVPLSDFIITIHWTPRSTKIAVAAVALSLVAGAFAACGGTSNDAELAALRQEVESLKAEQERAANQQSPTAPAPAPPPVPTPTPRKIATPTPKPPPTSTPTPTATPGPRISDYYVVLSRSIPTDKIGVVQFFVNYPDHPLGSNVYETGSWGTTFNDEDFFLDYLLREGTITDWQHRAYFLDNDVKIYLDDIAVAIQKLVQRKGYRWIQSELGISRAGIDETFLPYYDRSPLALEEGFVVIRDGRLETMKTNADGETVRVQVDDVDTDDFLDYLLRQGRITAEQHSDYIRSRELLVSFEDAADAMEFFEWSTNDGISTESLGVDKESVDLIPQGSFSPLFLLRG